MHCLHSYRTGGGVEEATCVYSAGHVTTNEASAFLMMR